MLKWLKFILFSLILIISCSSKTETAGITLTFWQFWTDPEVKPVLMDLIQKFEEQNPGIKVEVTDLTWSNGHEKIVVAFGSNSAPDVLELGSDWVPEFAYKGVLYDMTAEVDSILKFYRMWEPATIDSNVYAFPWILDTRVLFYNRDLLRRAGLNPDKPPQNWQELLNAARKINSPEKQVYGFGANSAEKHRLYKKFLPFFWSNNGLLLSPDGTQCWINSKEGRMTLEFYVELCKHGLLDTQLRLDEAFTQGKLGFVLSGGWLLQQIKKNNPNLDFGVALMPRPSRETGYPASFAGGEFLAINSKSKHPQEAMKFVRYMTNLENALVLCKAIGSPSPSDALAPLDPYYSNDPHLSLFQEQLNFSRTPPVTPQWVYIEEEIEKAVEQAMYGKKTPKAALDEAKEKIDKLLAKTAKTPDKAKDESQSEDRKEKKTSAKESEFAPDIAKQMIASRASQVLLAIRNKDMQRLPDLIHPKKGVRFSPYGYINQKEDLVFKSKQIVKLMQDQTKYTWGRYDGSGEPITLTFAEYYQRFVYSVDFMRAPKLGYNTVIGKGNTINNWQEVYPNCIMVEYHFPGFDENLQGMDWKSLRLIFEREKDMWYLVGIINDQGTI